MKKNTTYIKKATFSLLLAFLMIMASEESYATAWTTATAGAVTTLANWTNGSGSPTSFTTPGDTWTVTLAMTLPSGTTWIVGTTALSPAIVTVATGGTIALSGTAPSGTITIYGNLVMGGGNISLSATGGTENINVYGDVNMSGGMISTGGNSPTINMNIHGNYTMTGGAYSFSGTVAILDMTIYGNCSISGASAMTNVGTAGYNTIHMALPSSSGSMSLENISTGTWSRTYIYVDTGCIAQLGGNFSTSTGYGVVVNGTLICPAPYVLNGTGAFTVDGSATLELANAAGVNGNVITTGTKLLSAKANYVFNGTVPQVTGTYLPAALTSPDTITINNAAGVTLSQNTSTTGILLFSSGVLHTGTFTMTTPGTATGVAGAGAGSYVDGTLVKTITGISAVNYEVGNIDYAPMNLALSAPGTAGSLGVKCVHGMHPNVSTSGMLTSNIVNHYWTITTYSAAGPYLVIPQATYNFGDIIGGGNLSFVTQEYAGGAWLGAPIATNNASSPYTSVLSTTGVTLGSLAGSYIFGNSCGSQITGATNICTAGTTTALSNAISGGTWSSSNIAVATVTGAGVVSGVLTGTAVIYYTTASCSVSDVITVSVSPITGSSTLCPSSTTNLSNATPGGVWSSNNTAVATIDSSGVVYGIAGGSVNISYTVGSCTPVVHAMTITTLTGIIGNPSICTGGTDVLSDAVSGGVWTSNNTSVATVSGSGVAYGVSYGTATISYSVGSCATGFTVTDATIPPITGITTVCGGNTISLSDAGMAAGGTWSSSNTSIATVSGTGIVSGLPSPTAGTAIIIYTYGSCSVSTSVTVNANFPIAGPTTVVCIGSVIMFSDAVSGGTWSSSNTTRATVGVAAGIAYVTGISSTLPSPGIIYTLPTGCTETITVTIAGTAPITGPSTVCSGSVIHLSDAAPGGTWSSSNTSVGTISSAGVVTGVSAGITNISYVIGTCSSFGATVSVVSGAAPITGPSGVCTGATIALSDATPGGTWSSSNPAKASVSAGVVTGVSSTAPSPVISYTLPGGCNATATVTVYSASSITGVTSICASGGAVNLSDAAGGGTWSTGSSGIATVGLTSGTVTGISAGTAHITYSTSGGCSATATITVNPLPASITGVMPVCVGSTVVLSDATSGGIWSCSPASIAGIGGATGIVSGVSNGTATISYTILGCFVTSAVQVNGPQVPQICVVDLDSASGKNLVVWEQFVPNRVAWFNIYRQNSSSVFVKIDSQAANIFSTYLDPGSYPILQSYSYQLTATDSCGNESLLGSSTTHTTVHLNANLGVGGVVNLIWNTYVGKPVTTQNIMRSTGGGPFVSIASVANTLTSYTDATPPSGSLVYQINSVMASGCSPSARTTAYDIVSSNPVYISPDGINNLVYDPEIKVYPNPASTALTITSTLQITDVSINDLLGQKVYSNKYNAKQIVMDISQLPDGIYFIKINNNEVRKFVKE